MTFELLSGLSGSWSDLLAVLATTLSGSALYTAFRMSEQMRRRVDGELGELPPNFALYPAPPAVVPQANTANLELRIDNHNRRPIRVTSLRVEQPGKTGLMAYHLVEGRDVVLGDVNRRHNEVFTSLVVEGTPPGASQFHSTRLKLVVSSGQPLFSKRGKPSKLSLRVDFELLKDVPEKQNQVVSVEIRPATVPKESPSAGWAATTVAAAK